MHRISGCVAVYCAFVPSSPAAVGSGSLLWRREVLVFSWGSVDMAMWQSFGAAVWWTGTGCEAELSSWHACRVSIMGKGAPPLANTRGQH